MNKPLVAEPPRDSRRLWGAPTSMEKAPPKPGKVVTPSEVRTRVTGARGRACRMANATT